MAKLLRKFGKEDIGGELLPILTTGLYKDVLDTLREYIQNSIDAKAKNIALKIDVDQIVIKDNGTGMSFEESRKAIRLGISDKNPLINVGFRGIGIYSAFNLCDNAEIYTKSKGKETYLISFDFKRIRHEIFAEQEKRKHNKEPQLYLEKLLNETVMIAETSETPIKSHGTLVILSGIRSDVYNRLNNWYEVSSYLEKVVPLPFNPKFKFAKEIEERFHENDYPSVSITLQINEQREKLYKPYANDLFHFGGKYPVKFYRLKDKDNKFGFAWVCINDRTAVLKNKLLRGLLIKRLGFSINDRSFLERYFSLSTKYRRITGEVILQNNNLIPNAARSDFEYNLTRQAFFEYIPTFIGKLTKWIDNVDREEKARQILASSIDKLKRINSTFPKIRRDKEKLLVINNRLKEIERQLKPHDKLLNEIDNKAKREVDKYLHDCIIFVTSELTKTKRKRKDLERKISDAIKRDSRDLSKEEKKRLADTPKTIFELIDFHGLNTSEELLSIISYIDDYILQASISEKEYMDLITQLQEYIEEKF